MGRRGGGGDDASGHVPARPRTRAVARGVRAALAAPDRRALRRESVPAREAPAVPGRPEALAGRHPGPLRREPRRPRHRPEGARPPLRGGQLGVADARGVGGRLAGPPRRHGDHAVHVLPAGRRHRPRADHGRDHVRARADHDVPRETAERLRHRVGARHHVRRGAQAGRVRGLEVRIRGGRHGSLANALRAVRGRGGALSRRGARASGVRLRAEVLARVQHPRRARRRLGDGSRRRHPARARARGAAARMRTWPRERPRASRCFRSRRQDPNETRPGMAEFLFEILAEEIPAGVLPAARRSFSRA